MTLEAIMTEIRDELKRSNDLKAKQLQDFTDISEEPAGWTQLPTEEPKEEESAKEEPDSNVPDESEMKKAVAKIIKGTDTDKKDKLKAKIKEIGAKKVSDIKPEQRQIIIDYIEEL
ncbi:hypothetical protein [Staphylococcus pseudoxylosus]|uniref:hypothetical protein n=1 Tax=Staphylococcus pseudoxylosus TaxID=2282419 RepID=UPI000D1DA365|nr:hypothetical protein [Staphylococcus pseudoxylosus]MBM2657584.1 hypothetical protein [Staphylococcus pseudoxylosus]PTI83658.1 hypothetical protein BU098_01885 [Staphylococcus xylosus]